MLVTEGDEDLLSVPSGLVGSITTFGAVGLSAGARTFALANGVDVTFVSRRGRLLGWLNGATQTSVITRRAQYRSGDDTEFRAAMARAFVAGKLANLRALLLRYGHRDGAVSVVEAAERIDELRTQALQAGDVATVLGFEGAGSRAYFGAFSRLLPEEVTFPGRVRNPPTDPVNSALSFGYTVLTGAAVAAAGSAGLDPVAGFLHADEANRPSMALDLIEEFRPLVVDTTVLAAFRRRVLRPDRFRTEEQSGAVLLTEAGRKAFLAALEERMLEVFAHVPSGTRTSYRRALYLQARQVASCVRGGVADYQPVSWR